MNDTPKDWKAGRAAASILFVGGSFWAWHLFPAKPADWIYYVWGCLIWILWGIRAFNFGPVMLHRMTWVLSLGWHALWLCAAVAATVATAGFALFALPIQTAWCLLVMMISCAFIIGRSDA